MLEKGKINNWDVSDVTDISKICVTICTNSIILTSTVAQEQTITPFCVKSQELPQTVLGRARPTPTIAATGSAVAALRVQGRAVVEARVPAAWCLG